ncbi:YCF48-related protein [Sphaerotilus sp.]|uniref:WD40/YVTN/BNR-like repeat-containing protein n=1 Tax=Sphaerotilus sp. TaxID=2093942 RepID=UPI00286DD6FC|nr:YCF48-related protein [Sphaerotilus sp.]
MKSSSFVRPRAYASENATAFAIALVIAWGATVQSVKAAVVFPALERSAVQVRTPERSVLQAATMAGARIVAVGERGIVLLSDDLGAHWRQAKGVPVSVTLTAVRFVDANMGWAVGHAGVVLHSVDGGETWVRQTDGLALAKLAVQEAQERARLAPNDPKVARDLKAAQLLVSDGPDKPLLDLHFSDAKHGFVVGAYNLFFETSDGGATWTSAMGRLDNPKGLHLYAIRAQRGAVYIVGEQGLMLRSEDGGKRFEPLVSPYVGSWFTLLTMPDGALLAAGLRGNAYYSRDQGQTWSRIQGAAPVSFICAVALPDGAALLVNQAGQLLTSRTGEPMVDLGAPSLPPLADVLPLPGGAGLLAMGMGGVIRLPAPTAVVPGAVR